MDHTLITQNLLARNTNPRSLHICETWRRKDFLQICFSSVGCRFRKTGYCTMCDYGGDRNITADEAVSGLEEALSKAPNAIQEILLGTCGSILDEREMDAQVLEAILQTIRKTTIPSVILETHYITVTNTVLERIKKILPDRDLVIEMGFESANPYVLEHCLGKYMNLDALSETIYQIHTYGISPVLNVFLGAPFLSPEEQLKDAEQSITWAIAHGASRVVIFPSNIKPNTLLWKLYQENNYCQISHWLLIELLSKLDDILLEKVELSWYGDRQDLNQSMQILPPKSCPSCHPALMTFYEEFMTDFNPTRRKFLLAQLNSQIHCNCRKNLCIHKII